MGYVKYIIIISLIIILFLPAYGLTDRRKDLHDRNRNVHSLKESTEESSEISKTPLSVKTPVAEKTLQPHLSDTPVPVETADEIVISKTPVSQATPVPTIKAFTEPEKKDEGFPVTLNGEILFYVYKNVGPYSKEERADVISKRLKILLEDPEFQPEFISVVKKDDVAHILYEDKSIMTITEEEALSLTLTPLALAKEDAEKIKTSIRDYKEKRSAQGIIKGIISALISTLIFIVLLLILSKFFRFLKKKIETFKGTRIKDLRFQKLTILSSNAIADGFNMVLKVIHYFINLLLLYVYISLVFSFFVWTKNYGKKLIEFILTLLLKVWTAFITYLPNLFTIIFTIYILYYLFKFIGFLFRELDKGAVVLPGFKQDWAQPTGKILKFLIFALGVALIFPLLPGVENPAFKGLSIFVGVLFSLGSTSAISNIVAGTILIYMDAFKVGDRVQIADKMGDIVVKSLLVTKIRTIKNVEITVPNSMILGNHITNYSACSQDKGLILNTTVTLGYDVPWRKVHKALIDAALATDMILKEPEPFIFQTSLDDYYVSYQLNAFTNDANKMAAIYSDLHQNIQDKCNETDIEILSPHYRAVRDGNQVTIPAEYLPENYKAPTFRVQNIKD